MPSKAVTAAMAGATYLELNGQVLPLVACTLPDMTWDAIRSAPGGASDGEVRLGGLKLGELALRFAPNMMPPLAGWVDEFATGKAVPVDLAIVRADMDGKVRERLLFRRCVLTGLGFPECSGAGKEAYVVDAAFQPETIAAGAEGGVVKVSVPGRQKRWLAANFVFTLGGLPTARVRRVGALGIRRPLLVESAGNLRRPGATAGMVEWPSLTVEVGGPDYAAWRDFAFKQAAGNPPVATDASLDLRDSTLKTVLGSFTFRLAGLDGFRIDMPATADALQLATASFALQGMTLKVN